MGYVPVIDEASCIAQGDCMDALPEVFEVEEHARVIGTATDERLLDAARACPVEAIALLDSQTGKQVYP